jgi:adenylate cyclase
LDRAVERRLAAILITDVVGYSRMISVDEEGTLRRYKLLRREVIDPRIAAAQGRIIKSTGDGVMVEFPSSVRAVTCAVEIQRAATRHNAALPEGQAMEMRIGINLGDVIAEPDGDLYGDGVNVAARLEPLAEPGGLCISRSVHDQVRDRLPYRFEDKGKLPLKNITRPIGVFALSAATLRDLPEPAVEESSTEAARAATSSQAAIASSTRRATRWRWPLGGAGAIILLAACAGLGWWSWPKASLADKTLAVQAGLPAKPLPPLSLVVLPFTNLSSDPEQEFFADGLTEDLTTDLSHLSGSFVIARNTAFTYKGKAVDIRQLGRDLGVRYALEGSVRRMGERIVRNAQLISTETGAHLWADRFEGDRARLGELQVEFVARLAHNLDVQLTQAESLRSQRERPDNPDAADLTMRGWAVFNRPRSKANVSEAAALFEKALQIDHDSLRAIIGLSRAKSAGVLSRWSENPAADIELASKLATRALEIDGGSALARFAKGEVYRAKREFEQSFAMYESAIESDQNFSTAYAVAGHTKTLTGQAEETRAMIATALRLSPRDPQLHIWKYWMCHSYTHQARWEESIEWCNRSVSDSPLWYAYIDLAASYAWTGNQEAARNAVAQILKLKPGYTVRKWSQEDWSNNAQFLAEYARITEGLRKAGLPED